MFHASEPHHDLPHASPTQDRPESVRLTEGQPASDPAWIAARETHRVVFRIDGPSRPQTHLVEPGPHRPIRDPRTQRLLEAFLGHARAVLRLSIRHDWAAHPTVSRLVSFGFQPEWLCELGLGLFSTADEVRESLVNCGFSASEIREAKVVADARLPGRLVGPTFDGHGQIHSLWAWNPQAERPRYLYLRPDGQPSPALLWPDDSMPSGGSILVVEDLLDATYLRAQGFTDTAAIGGPVCRMTFARWQELADLGVRRVVLAPCWGRQSAESIWDAAGQASGVCPCLTVYVLGAEALGTAGPAELVRQQGSEALWQLLRHIQSHADPSSSEPESVPEPPSAKTPLPCPAPEPSLCALKVEVDPEPEPSPPVVDEIEDEEPAPAPLPSPALLPVLPVSAPADWCFLHDCRTTDCFCFD